ncbi:hypothetical protein QA600_04940 [Natronococcus sp. A-GB1]|uniref:DUF7562 family protein n=1 Tax=Natronococcus sp. A-GB1 TaxID=3037648 RepID=UPI0024200D21|nr:hypothetical protein [Natronococcus sp. A-GB1]MDG5758681.1 hypothetical protein [Natronococcus sp. A-GB1]
MWFSRNRDPSAVCPACGSEIPRSSAREYDKYGDRWERENKRFEYLCKPCYAELCHHLREGLEALLVELEDEQRPWETFLAQYVAAVENQDGRLEEES